MSYPVAMREPPPLPNKPLSTNPDELRAAIELSKSEADRQAALLAKLSSQEEEELTRALQESMRDVQNLSNSFSSALSQGSPTIYSTAPGSSTELPKTQEDEEELTWLQYSTLNGLDDEEDESIMEPFDRQDMTTPSTPKASLLPYDYDEPPPASPAPASPAPPQVSDDEALARQLAAEEVEDERLSQQRNKTEPPDIPPEHYSKPLTSTIDDEVLARKLAAEEEAEIMAEQAAVTAVPTQAARNSHATTAPPAYTDGMPQSSCSSSPTTTSNLSRNSSASSITSLKSMPAGNPIPVADSKPTSPPVVPLPPVQETEFDPPSPPPLQPMMQPVTANQFVDQNLLRGVSVGFTAPTISLQLQPMQGPMPNIIQLPYGRCSPLHLQAPSWRHLLKLLAWLSGSRMEPSVEAVAVTKADSLYLRTVIQFVKPHPTSIEWRIVLWFTLDHPVPASLPNARKYTNGDVDVLPWSYTLSTLPALLQDGNDSAVSKTYTIPAVDGIPYPPLPISFPSLAMYLNAVVETSRRYTNDSSSGVRKLARMIDACYPNEFEPAASSSTDRGVGKLFKKVVGRNNKRRSGRGNEDTYDLVTPFVADQY